MIFCHKSHLLNILNFEVEVERLKKIVEFHKDQAMTEQGATRRGRNSRIFAVQQLATS